MAALPGVVRPLECGGSPPLKSGAKAPHSKSGTFLALVRCMAEKNNEPQSYGSQSEWVRGETGQEVTPNQPQEDEAEKKVTGAEGGAKRDSYFKKRDY